MLAHTIILARSRFGVPFQLNRRGFAPSIQCEPCGDIIQCPTCSVSTTLHRTGGLRLRCHYCDYETPLPPSCPSCGCERLAMIGLGTERLEEILEMAFPTPRVARLDRDVAPGIRSEAVIDKMRRKQADILVGTQMVTKGHDLPDVTVVGVINADAALSLPDFRAAERTFQLLVQVAGRDGRAQRPGRVIVQTRIPEHAVLQHAKNHDVLSFVEHELCNRQEAGYPPYARLALVRLDSADEDRVRQEAERLAVIARSARRPIRRGRRARSIARAHRTIAWPLPLPFALARKEPTRSASRGTGRRPRSRRTKLHGPHVHRHRSGHLPGAINMPVGVGSLQPGRLGDKGTPIVVYCASGCRSADAARTLRKADFTVLDLGPMLNGSKVLASVVR